MPLHQKQSTVFQHVPGRDGKGIVPSSHHAFTSFTFLDMFGCLAVFVMVNQQLQVLI